MARSEEVKEAIELRDRVLAGSADRFEEQDDCWIVKLNKPVNIDGEDRERVRLRKNYDMTVGDRMKIKKVAKKLTDGEKPEADDLLLASVCLSCGLAPGEFLRMSGDDADLLVVIWASGNPEFADPKA